MIQIKRKPTSPGVRAQKRIKFYTSGDKPLKRLLSPLKGPKGRGLGKISVRHQSRGAKKHYRLIDFKRDNKDIPGVVKTIEYDPVRNASICLIFYKDGDKRYILAPNGLKVGDNIISSDKVKPNIGNCMLLKNIPLGTKIHNIELNPNAGGIMARGAGTSCYLMSKEDKYVNLKMPSGEIRKVLQTCKATIGEVSNAEYKNQKFGKAGVKRHMGIRPGVRGVAMSNPRKHPHAGSYTSAGIGKPSPVSPTGVKSKGFKTRRRKKTDVFIVKDRRKK